MNGELAFWLAQDSGSRSEAVDEFIENAQPFPGMQESLLGHAA
jgi:hypothetical protein